MTHEFDNHASQTERREVLRNDTLFSRQQNSIDDSGGRFTKLTPSTLTGQSYQVPQLPASSPWANGFDTNLEPPLGIAEMPEPVPIPTTAVVASPATVEVDRTEPAVGVVNFPAALAAGSSIKRRGFGG